MLVDCPVASVEAETTASADLKQPPDFDNALSARTIDDVIGEAPPPPRPRARQVLIHPN